MAGRHTRSIRKGSYIISLIGDEEIYVGRKFIELPVGTKIVTKNNTEFEIIFKDNQKYCRYLDFTGEFESSPITNDEFWVVREDETVIYPHGYESPLWKVLNGEDVE